MRKTIYSAAAGLTIATLLTLSATAPVLSAAPAQEKGLDIGAIQSTVDLKALPDGNLAPEVFR